jgi:hypothetical protein
MTRPTCDTPGCGKPIPVGGEGHPEICPDCLREEARPRTPAELIAAECDAIKAMLLKKNAAYGNSALDPMRVFSRASSEEQILVRIDDKLSRLARGSAAGEDVIADLLGYLVLLRVARKATP